MLYYNILEYKQSLLQNTVWWQFYHCIVLWKSFCVSLKRNICVLMSVCIHMLVCSCSSIYLLSHWRIPIQSYFQFSNSVFDPQSNHHLPSRPPHLPVSRLYRSRPVSYLHSESCFATSSNHHILTFHELFSLFQKNYIVCFQMFCRYCKTFVMFYKCMWFSCGKQHGLLHSNGNSTENVNL